MAVCWRLIRRNMPTLLPSQRADMSSCEQTKNGKSHVIRVDVWNV